MPIANRNSPKLESILVKAEDFHGHLGPFLTIGIRMGLMGKKLIQNIKDNDLMVSAELPLHVPYSCILDGLQVSTGCTIGNQKLSIKENQTIQVEFKNKINGQIVAIVLNQQTFRRLKSQLLHEQLSDKEVRQLAWEVAAIPESELFLIH